MVSPEQRAHGDADDRIERLLLDLVGRPDADQGDALAAACAAHPALAERLRQRHARYRRFAELAPEPRGDGARFGEFELLRELGRGGMGVVWLARQRRAGQERTVALKLVRDRGLLAPHARERLRREAAAAFRLDDPGLCPVLDAGETDGVPWLAMRYVPGRTLAEHLAAARRGGALALPSAVLARTADADVDERTATTSPAGRFAAVLALGEALARSLHCAHEAGFVHRDVKPGNVMITPDGQPVLLDFGLVRDESQDHSLTATGETLGTPAYMAPEQVEGRERVDRTADVYGLAATLFEAIALEPPFAGRTREELFRRILQGDAQDLRRLVPSAPRDLRVVLATALQRDRRHRYATALEFALELRRVRRREPILARPPGPLRRLWLWSQRNRLAAALLLSLAVALGVVVATARDALRAAAAEAAERARAVATLRSARTAALELVRVQQTQIDDVPWLEDQRRELQQRAANLLRMFAATTDESPELALDTASTLVIGASLELSMGRLDEAERLHEEAERLLASLPQQPAAAGTRGRWHLFDGVLAKRRGDLAAALAAFAAGASQLAAALDDPGRTDEDVGATMHAFEELSEMRERTHDLPGAMQAVEHGLSLRAKLVAPESAEAVVQVGALLRRRAKLHRAGDDLAAADADYAAVGDLLERHLAAHPHDRTVTAALGSCRAAHASLLRLRGRGDAQRAALVDAQQRYERLVAAFPTMPTYRVALAGVLGSRASLLDTDGDHAGGLAALQRAAELLDAAVAAEPSNTIYRHHLAGVLHNRGNRLRDDRAVAGACYTAALGHLDRLLEATPDEASFLDLAARTAMNLAIGYAIDEDERAAPAFARAAGYAERLTDLRPDDRRALVGGAQLLFNQGAHLAEHDRLAEAYEVLGRAAAQGRRALAATPDDPARAYELLRTAVRRAHVAELHDPANAAAAWQAADADCASLRPATLARVQHSDGTVLAYCMLRRALAAPRARAGDAAAAATLVAVQQRLLAVLARRGDRAAAHLELCLCLADRIASAPDAGAAARLADELAERCAVWPADARLDRLCRRRLQHRLGALEAALGERAGAVLRLRAFAGAD